MRDERVAFRRHVVDGYERIAGRGQHDDVGEHEYARVIPGEFADE